MPYFTQIETESVISLEDFLNVKGVLNTENDSDFHVSLAPSLRKLANNKALMIKSINDYLKNPIPQEKRNAHSGQSVYLHSQDNILIRLNLWPTDREYAGSSDWISSVYAYNLMHNHNFDLLTTTVAGPGYETSIHTLEKASIATNYSVGDEVKLNYWGNRTLDSSSVLFLENYIDVHTQFEPKAPSISLNYIVNSQKSGSQYIFNSNPVGETFSVKDVPNGHEKKLFSALQFASIIGDEETKDILKFLIPKINTVSLKNKCLQLIDATAPT